MSEREARQGPVEPVSLTKAAGPQEPAAASGADPQTKAWALGAGAVTAVVVVLAGFVIGGYWVFYGLVAAVPAALAVAALTRRMRRGTGIFEGLSGDDQVRLAALRDGVVFGAVKVDDPGQLQYSLVALREVGVGLARELYLAEGVVFAAGCIVVDGGPRPGLVAITDQRVLLAWEGTAGATEVVSRALGDGLDVDLELVATGVGTRFESHVSVPGDPELVFSVVDNSRGFGGNFVQGFLTRFLRRG